MSFMFTHLMAHQFIKNSKIIPKYEAIIYLIKV